MKNMKTLASGHSEPPNRHSFSSFQSVSAATPPSISFPIPTPNWLVSSASYTLVPVQSSSSSKGLEEPSKFRTKTMLHGYLARKMSQLQNSSLSQALTAFTDIHELKRIHAHLIISGSTQNLFILARLLVFAALSHSGDLHYAKTIFHHVQHPNRTMHNTMIRALSESDEPLGSFNLYRRMLRAKVLPDNFTFPFLLKSSSFLLLGQQLHSHVVKFGFDADVFVVNNAIGMYSTCGKLDDAARFFKECSAVVDVVSWTTLVTGYSNAGHVDVARNIFDAMPFKNLVSWNAMIAGYARVGQIGSARKLFDEMPERNVASWSAMISGYSHGGMPHDAIFLLKLMMIRFNVVPNESALVSAVAACTHMRALEEGVWIHGYVLEQKFEFNVTLATALIDMYGKCGDAVKALKVFKEMPVKNVMSWNSAIAGLGLNGYGKQALSLFRQMQLMGPPPNSVTFIALLSGCSHSGLVDEGRTIFDIMTRVYEIRPELEHYGCMVDLLGRAGLIKEALQFVEEMPVEPHPGLYGALVGACRIHGDIELGQELGKQLVELEPHHGGRYTLLSNIFAAANRWDDVALVRNMLKGRKVTKTPGNSVVET